MTFLELQVWWPGILYSMEVFELWKEVEGRCMGQVLQDFLSQG